DPCIDREIRAQVTADSTGPRLSRVDGATEWGPTVKLSAAPDARPFDEIRELVFGQFNVLNLVQKKGKALRGPDGKILTDPPTGKVLKSAPSIDKPESQLRGVADTILRAKPDILTLVEVDSLEALNHLNTKYLGGKFRPIHIEGNDPRGIDVAFLIRKDLPF